MGNPESHSHLQVGATGMIGVILNFFLSMWGAMTILVGLVLFIMLPILSAITRFKAFTRLFLGMATFPLRRVGFIIAESNEAYFKQINLELGLLSTTLDDDQKLIEDPAQRMHHWLGIRFGLVNEEHGVVFDPRDAAIGMRKRAFNDRDEGEFLATDDEWDEWGITKWKPAVFEMPKKYEIVDLSAVKELIDGGERAEWGERVEELYKHSREPFGSGTPLGKYMYPILGFCIPFFGIWILKSQLGGSAVGESVSFSTAVSVSTLLLVGLGLDTESLSERVRAVDWALVAATIGFVGVPLGSLGLIGVIFSPGLAVGVAIALLLGMLIVPIITVLSQVSASLSGALSKLYFKLGFLGFQQPVFVWTAKKYVIREYGHMETKNQHQTTWYDMFGTVVGFSFEPDESSWGPEVMSHQELESEIEPKRNMLADGGSRNSNLPPKYVRSEQIQRDKYGGYLPKRLSDACYYLHSGIVLNRFANSAVGEKALRKLLEAKQEHGAAGSGVADSTVLKTTAVTTVVGALAGIGIFLLPALL